jgi:glyoxylase-like metal-dependent hydrolase (beta-lactamase superfamily II)
MNTTIANTGRRTRHLAFTFTLLTAMLSSPAWAEPSAANVASIRTGAYTYAGHGSVNTHWISTPKGVIVIDVQRDLDHARQALEAVKRLRQPVLAVLVTHGHPDHYAGIGLFKTQWPDAVVWSSQSTYDTIKNDHYGFNKLAAELAKGNFPDPVVLPDRTFADNATLSIGGVSVATREMGRAEANSSTVYYVPATGDLYAGDLVLNRMHGFFYEGATLENLAVLDRMATLFPSAKTLHAGHGSSGPAPELLARHRHYIIQARSLAARALAATGSSKAAQAAVVRSLKTQFPSFGIPGGQPDMIEVSVDGLFRELAQPTEAPVK